MATDFAINGTVAAIGPFSQRWRKIQIGTDHNLEPVYQATEEIDLSFQSCSITMSREWLEAASSGSQNITVLDRSKIEYTDLSAVYLVVNQYPETTRGVSGPFSITLKGVT